MDESFNNSRLNDGESSLLSYLVILANHGRMIIFTSTMVVILTYLYLFCSNNTYKAMTRLLPPQQNLTVSAQLIESLGGSGTPVSGTSTGGMAASLLGLKVASDIYVGILTSDSVYDRIIARYDLKKFYKTKTVEDTRLELKKSTSIRADQRSGIIDIEVKYTSPKMAVEVVKAFIKELNSLLQRLALQEAKGRLAFLEKERIQASQNLGEAEGSLRRFSEKNSVLEINTQTKGILEYIAKLRAEIDSKEVSMQVLGKQVTPYNFDLVRMETEVKSLKEKLHNSEKQYANCLSDVCFPSNKAPGLTLEYIRLYRQVKFQESLYQFYIKLVEIARLDMARNINVVQVLDIPKLPERRSNRRLFPAIIFGMLTFVIMIFVVLGRNLIHNMNISDGDAQQLAMVKHYLEPWREKLKRMKDLLCSKKRSWIH